MGLSVTLSNALSGMDVNQRSLDIVSRNVANAGTPGYHRQSVELVDGFRGSSASVHVAKIQRAYVQALETQTQRETSLMGALDVRAEYMGRLELLLGKPGDINSMDTQLSNLKSALETLATSPEDFVGRADVVDRAQTMAESLNFLSRSVQGMRQETESQMTVHVANLNQDLATLAKINQELMDTTKVDDTRLGILDERDRLLAEMSELVDIHVQYNDNGTINVATKTGIGLLDGEKFSTFQFENAGSLSPTSLYNVDPVESGVGSLKIVTPANLGIDVVAHDVLTSGRLSALLDLRDNRLVTAQDQLDEIAAGLAQAMSTIDTDGTAVSAAGAEGLEADLSNMLPGNSFTVTYEVGGAQQKVRVVRVDDASKLPMDSTDENGLRTIGLDFSGGIGAVASSLDSALGAAVTVSNPSGSVLRIMDDGASNTSDIHSMLVQTTATGTQNQGLGMSLFVDSSGAFTNSLDGTPQKRGFALRIGVNQDVVADNTLLVKHSTSPATPIGDADRPNYLIDRLGSMTFRAESAAQGQGAFRLNGNVEEIVRQTLNYQGNEISTTKQAHAHQGKLIETLEMRAEDAYGVDIDKEMGKLLQLQNAYSANARVMTIVQELLDRLMQAF
ncbi:flagellar hook-associated protein FlgK [Maritalea mediterranea]|uniref:Flagellar hook-associated protein 1 n=1 Tax=Maritalea mediterranea TaxID=2909667 RepID=A0ABS9EAB2_9HYPH|nr:flagellar hook-associated protein FlgK [Maritalea mediterranea]MCF4098834.1 flagellar hook-associated protein FlgK [Maritalea mediterranea]